MSSVTGWVARVGLVERFSPAPVLVNAHDVQQFEAVFDEVVVLVVVPFVADGEVPDGDGGFRVFGGSEGFAEEVDERVVPVVAGELLVVAGKCVGIFPGLEVGGHGVMPFGVEGGCRGGGFRVEAGECARSTATRQRTRRRGRGHHPSPA